MVDFSFRGLIVCKVTKTYKGVDGYQLIYRIEIHIILQESWQSPTLLCKDFEQ
jgi:hypothetical protein